MNMVAETTTPGNITPEVAGRRLYESGLYRIGGGIAHVCDDGYVYLVPIEETGPRCYCTEFERWGTCPHVVCILNALGVAEPVNMD